MATKSGVAVPQPKASQNGSKSGTTVPSKSEAIREAFGVLGIKAPTKDVQGFLEQKFGMTASNYYIGEQRGKLKKGKRSQPAAKAAPALRTEKPAAPVSQPNRVTRSGSATVVGNAVVAVKEMAEIVGWEEVANLVEVLRK